MFCLIFCYPSSHDHGSVVMGLSPIVSFLSCRVTFHFHDYGRKGISPVEFHFDHFEKKCGHFSMAGQPTPPPNVPFIKGNQWLISPDHKAGDFWGVSLGGGWGCLLTTWRIIPFSKWFITIVSKSPKDRVGLDPLPLNRTSWLK